MIEKETTVECNCNKIKHNVLLNIKAKRGITLIALVITIIVLLILAGITLNQTLGENGILKRADETKIKTELASIKEQYSLYLADKKIQDINFEPSSLNAGKNSLSYNTQSDDDVGNIYTILTNIPQEYVENFEIIKGELVFNSLNKRQLELAKDIGISINPYKIEGGELLSSETNLMLMDEKTGTLTIPDSITSIGDGAFANVTELRKVIIPGSVKKIGATAFSKATNLEEVVILDGVEEIGAKAFWGCTNLENVTLPDSIVSIGSLCFAASKKLTNIKLPCNLSTLSQQIFQSCSNLENVELPENLEIMQNEALSNTKISVIKFPKELKSIGMSALDIKTLKEIDTSINNYYEFKDNILYTKNLENLVIALPSATYINIANTVKTINGGAFAQCYNLSTINIPENVSNIHQLAFSNSFLTKITVDSNNNFFKTDENYNLYSKDGKILYRNFDIDNVIIKDGVENIVRGSFIDNKKIKKIKKIKTIKTIKLPESFLGTNLTWGIFPTLDYLYLPKNVQTFSKDAYLYIKTIEVSPDNPFLKSINNEYILNKDETKLYWVKSDLLNVQIPNTVTTIKQNSLMFTQASNIKLPESVTTLEANILFNADTQKLEIGSNIQTINISAFTSANNLREVIINKVDDGSLTGSPWANPYGARAIIWKK